MKLCYTCAKLPRAIFNLSSSFTDTCEKCSATTMVIHAAGLEPVESETQVTTHLEYHLTTEQLKILVLPHLKQVPKEVRIELIARVPSGGDYSGVDLNIEELEGECLVLRASWSVNE